VAVAPLALTHALHDRFKFERELGRGGMGLAFLARDLRHNRRVALSAVVPTSSGWWPRSGCAARRRPGRDRRRTTLGFGTEQNPGGRAR